MLDRPVLLQHRLIYTRIGMPDADREHAAKAIEIPVALIVPDVLTLALNESQRFLVISGHGRK